MIGEFFAMFARLNFHPMKVKTFDKLACVVILLSFAYSGVVAITQWDWFSRKDDWGHIADIPPDLINYIALLLPLTSLLFYLLVRRLYFKEPFK